MDGFYQNNKVSEDQRTEENKKSNEKSEIKFSPKITQQLSPKKKPHSPHELRTFR